MVGTAGTRFTPAIHIELPGVDSPDSCLPQVALGIDQLPARDAPAAADDRNGARCRAVGDARVVRTEPEGLVQPVVACADDHLDIPLPIQLTGAVAGLLSMFRAVERFLSTKWLHCCDLRFSRSRRSRHAIMGRSEQLYTVQSH
ncbi:hypothetical protein GCM10022251_53340 [Phytohabitans flavus]|uniref:Uncharacterized protein n=1 Tax=Phytohabitans flavus TaxID=1076124 RepID=A0A6F8XLV9_9ACTN|nr:hypothetical protein [Phytohabitans flavus]BCB74795.1 hypothetical protein Pflav_012050 [Phytohabitans flavus]